MALSALDIVGMAGGKTQIPSREAALILGYRTPGAYLEALRRGRLKLPCVTRGRCKYVLASSIADYLQAQAEEAKAHIDAVPTWDTPEVAEALRQQATRMRVDLSATDDADFLRKLAGRMNKKA